MSIRYKDRVFHVDVHLSSCYIEERNLASERNSEFASEIISKYMYDA